MIRTIISTIVSQTALAGGLALFAVPAAAQSVEVKAIEAKNLGTKQQIDPALGYILISAPGRSTGTFIKAPSDADRAEYQADWDKAFAKAQKKYASALKYWQAQRAAKQPTGERPIEPTPATFSIGEIERRLTVGYGPMFVFEKAEDDAVSYLMQVEPGTYTYYGPIMIVPNGAAAGSCFCMGTVAFEVKPGAITNLGDFLSLGWADDEAMRLTAAVAPPPGRNAAPASYPVPAALAKYTVTPADWRAAGKLNNFFGIAVSRMPPVEGVLGYERDRVIDLRAP
jgi:hypothetical protein